MKRELRTQGVFVAVAILGLGFAGVGYRLPRDCCALSPMSQDAVKFTNRVEDARAQVEPEQIPDSSAAVVGEAPRVDDFASRRGRHIGMIQREASANGLPVEIADAVAFVESGYEESAIGDVGEIGLMQVRPATAAMLGFRGSDAELARPAVNIRYGVAYLAQAWRLAGGDLCGALAKYRAGHGEAGMTAKSVAYCRAARTYLASNGWKAADEMTKGRGIMVVARRAVTLAPEADRQPRLAYRHADSSAFWAAHEARIKIMKQQVYARWRRMADSHPARSRVIAVASGIGER